MSVSAGTPLSEIRITPRILFEDSSQVIISLAQWWRLWVLLLRTSGATKATVFKYPGATLERGLNVVLQSNTRELFRQADLHGLITLQNHVNQKVAYRKALQSAAQSRIAH